MKSKLVLFAMLVAMASLLVGCGCTKSDADVASKNLSKAAEQFEVPRRIVGINGITDKYLWVVEGFCSVETSEAQIAGTIEAICKTEDGYKRTNLGLSDNVTFVIQQGKPTKVSTTRYRIIFKPETIVPNFDRP